MHGEEGLRLIRGERERVEGEGKGDGQGKLTPGTVLTTLRLVLTDCNEAVSAASRCLVVLASLGNQTALLTTLFPSRHEASLRRDRFLRVVKATVMDVEIAACVVTDWRRVCRSACVRLYWVQTHPLLCTVG